MLKENIYPTRQGQYFKLNLGVENGPFLVKDIMHTNKSSISLLNGRQILQSFNSMNSTFNILQMKTKQIGNLFPQKVDCLSNGVKFCEKQLEIIWKESNQLVNQQKKLKNQIQNFFDIQKREQAQLLGQCMPLLKNFMKKIKEVNVQQMDDFHLISRQLNEIQMNKKILVSGILECQRKIIRLQQIIGYQTFDIVSESDQIKDTIF